MTSGRRCLLPRTWALLLTWALLPPQPVGGGRPPAGSSGKEELSRHAGTLLQPQASSPVLTEAAPPPPPHSGPALLRLRPGHPHPSTGPGPAGDPGSGGEGGDSLPGPTAASASSAAPSAQSHCRLQPAPEGGVIADCRGAGLTHVPRDLPSDTVSLDLGSNRLTGLRNTSFSHLTSLRTLLLDQNQLTLTYESFPPDVFRPLGLLETLDIRCCLLSDEESYPGDIFLPLRNLTTLSMDLLRNAVFGEEFSCLTSLEVLWFTSDEILHLRNNTFSGFSESKVRRLEITDADVRSLEEETFSPFKQLTELLVRWTFNLELTYVFQALRPFRGRNMSLLNFEGSYARHWGNFRSTRLQVITDEMSAVLSDICVDTVILSSNYLETVSIQSLMKAPFVECVRRLDLSENPLDILWVDVFVWYRFSQLQFLDVSPKKKDCADYFIQMDNTKQTLKFMFPPNLRNLSLAQFFEGFGPLGNVNISNANNLRSFNFSCLGVTLQGAWHGFTGLESLDLSYNNLSFVPPNFFRSLGSLRRLWMRRVYLDQTYLMTRGRSLLEPLVKVRELDLADNGLRALPRTRLAALRSLDVSGNSFTELPLPLDLLPSLRSLKLARNALTLLGPDSRAQLEAAAGRHRLTVSLEGNPLSCDCSALPFLHWLRTTRVRLTKGGDYSCLGEDGVLTTTGEVTPRYHALWWRCHRAYILSVCGAVLASVLVAAVFSFFVVKFKTQLRRMIAGCLGFGQMVRQRKDYDFDVFLAYCGEDTAYVVRDLRLRLEEAGLRVFLLGRDDMPASVHADEIFRGIYSSWRVLFVLTPSFLQDEWCLCMVNTAVRSVTTLNPERLLLLEQQPIALARLPASLLQAVPEAAIFRLPGARHQQASVYTKLCGRVLGDEGSAKDCCRSVCSCFSKPAERGAREAEDEDVELLVP